MTIVYDPLTEDYAKLGGQKPYGRVDRIPVSRLTKADCLIEAERHEKRADHQHCGAATREIAQYWRSRAEGFNG